MVEMHAMQPAPEVHAIVLLCAYFTAAYGYQKEKLEDGRETLGSPFATGAKVVIEEHEMPEMVQTMVRRSTPFSSSTL